MKRFEYTIQGLGVRHSAATPEAPDGVARQAGPSTIKTREARVWELPNG